MLLKELVTPSLNTLARYYLSNKLLLIHPSSRFRTLLIAALIESPPCPMYYYGMGVEDIDLPQFLASLTHALADQKPTFGRYINQIRNQTDNIEELAEALANDLGEMEGGDFILLLDEYDRADEIPDIQTLIEYLLQYLPAHCHILINSRTLPRLPWMALVAKHEAVVLRDSKMLTSGFYREPTPANPNVEVYALGPGYVLVNGHIVDTWEGHLPRLLFFFALDRPLVTRADICQAFWPELMIDQAVNVFHVTKRRLHKAFGFDVLVHEGNHYKVNPELNLQYDVQEYVENLVEARASFSLNEMPEAAEFYQTVVDLYRGNYLQGHSDPWLTERRNDFREGYLEALLRLSHIRENEGNLEVALGLCLRAVSEAYNREDLHREILRLYGILGRRSEAVEHYQRLVDDFALRYDIAPSPETQAIFEKATAG